MDWGVTHRDVDWYLAVAYGYMDQGLMEWRVTDWNLDWRIGWCHLDWYLAVP